jgi:hypothetical protein
VLHLQPQRHAVGLAFTTDPDGHGTNTAGIAGENTGNGLGFAGAGGNISLMGYRVFPTPDDNCTPGNPAGDTDDQCSATTPDIASALEDAVNNGANVISMSFGGGYAAGGVDPDRWKVLPLARRSRACGRCRVRRQRR